ncbi:pet8p [Saccharomyces arboricola H-6]|uniref:Putative mitochondrial carrier protein PET8 n=1 Tax=Saccharomyces arboricola (strain H-6 / AS 2.3317 / CBS 10644) TaxID=1160507 RepID=J8PZS9_SACAR|nr:pet8p [Saccharomyces arboricola H-6]
MNTFFLSLLSGAAAGTSTDLVFFPIDTIKTRLQAKGGFFANGGYKGIYRGLGSAVVASAPGASLFFISYDYMKVKSRPYVSKLYSPGSEQLVDTTTHMLSSSIGEICACLVRVPAEVVKQRTQVHSTNSSWQTLQSILRNDNGEGLRKNLYRGWSTTIMREIPFTCIQFPLYEYLKKTWAKASEQTQVEPWKGAVCGSIAGGIAAATTTPLDFLKTRLMLNKRTTSLGNVIIKIYREEGAAVFFSGVGPRTMWISAGGAIFLGMYETVHSLLSNSSLTSGELKA